MVNIRCSGATEVCGFVNPGATLQQVCSSLQPACYSEKDQVVLIAGFNDIPQTVPVTNVLENLTSIVNYLKNRNAIVCTLPYRYNCDFEDSIHKDILNINNHISTLASKFSHVKVVDLYKRRYHTR